MLIIYKIGSLTYNIIHKVRAVFTIFVLNKELINGL